MFEEDRLEAKDLEWATFLYNAMGEDNAYIEDTSKVKRGIENRAPGVAIVDFLNHWRMRVSTEKVPPEFNEWYNNEGRMLLASLPLSLSEISMNDEKVISTIAELYNGLDRIQSINDTSVSKILHILCPVLFVMWDNEIRSYYLTVSEHKSGPKAYLHFLKRMQVLARSLLEQNKNISQDLSLKTKKLLEGNLRNFSNGSELEKLKQMITFLADEGKPITKFLDEYNWIAHTKKVTIPPAWHP